MKALKEIKKLKKMRHYGNSIPKMRFKNYNAKKVILPINNFLTKKLLTG